MSADRSKQLLNPGYKIMSQIWTVVRLSAVSEYKFDRLLLHTRINATSLKHTTPRNLRIQNNVKCACTSREFCCKLNSSSVTHECLCTDTMGKRSVLSCVDAATLLSTHDNLHEHKHPCRRFIWRA